MLRRTAALSSGRGPNTTFSLPRTNTHGMGNLVVKYRLDASRRSPVGYVHSPSSGSLGRAPKTWASNAAVPSSSLRASSHMCGSVIEGLLGCVRWETYPLHVRPFINAMKRLHSRLPRKSRRPMRIDFHSRFVSSSPYISLTRSSRLSRRNLQGSWARCR